MDCCQRAIDPHRAGVFRILPQPVPSRGHERRRGPRSLYHRASQLMAGLILPIGITLAFFSRDVLQLWTQDPPLAEKTHAVLSILLLGTIINGLMNIPYGL